MSALRPSQAPLYPWHPPLDAITQSFPLVITISLGIVALLSFIIFTGGSKLPLANPPRWHQTVLIKRLEFLKDGRGTLDEARKRFGKQPYRLLADFGEVIVLPPDHSITIRNENSLSFGKSIERVASRFTSKRTPMLMNFLEFPRPRNRIRTIWCPGAQE